MKKTYEQLIESHQVPLATVIAYQTGVLPPDHLETMESDMLLSAYKKAFYAPGCQAVILEILRKRAGRSFELSLELYEILQNTDALFLGELIENLKTAPMEGISFEFLKEKISKGGWHGDVTKKIQHAIVERILLEHAVNLADNYYRKLTVYNLLFLPREADLEERIIRNLTVEVESDEYKKMHGHSYSSKEYFWREVLTKTRTGTKLNRLAFETLVALAQNG